MIARGAGAAVIAGECVGIENTAAFVFKAHVISARVAVVASQQDSGALAPGANVVLGAQQAVVAKGSIGKRGEFACNGFRVAQIEHTLRVLRGVASYDGVGIGDAQLVHALESAVAEIPVRGKHGQAVRIVLALTAQRGVLLACADAVLTNVVCGAGIEVVAGHLIDRFMRASEVRMAQINCAGVFIVTRYLAAHAHPSHAYVVHGAGIFVIARQAVG